MPAPATREPDRRAQAPRVLFVFALVALMAAVALACTNDPPRKRTAPSPQSPARQEGAKSAPSTAAEPGETPLVDYRAIANPRDRAIPGRTLQLKGTRALKPIAPIPKLDQRRIRTGLELKVPQKPGLVTPPKRSAVVPGSAEAEAGSAAPPTPEPTPEPTSDGTPEPTPEPTSDGTPEPTPEPTSDGTSGEDESPTSDSGAKGNVAPEGDGETGAGTSP